MPSTTGVPTPRPECQSTSSRSYRGIFLFQKIRGKYIGTDFYLIMNSKAARCSCLRAHATTSLFAAVKVGNSSLVEKTLQSGADVNAIDKYGETPLIIAARRGMLQCMRLLIREGASVNWLPNEQLGSTALFYSAYTGNLSCLRELLYHSADVNLANCSNRTPLWAAVINGQTECLRALITAGAAVNFTSRDGYSVLMEASAVGHTEGVKLLLSAGAHVNYTRSNGETALMMTTISCNYNIAKVLLRSGAHVNTKVVVDETLELELSRCLLSRSNRMGVEHSMAQKLRCLLHAAGEKFVPFADNFPENEVPSLKELCRVKIRKHLIELDPNHNLFLRIPLLGLPWVLKFYLLYDESLSQEEELNEGQQ